jgi:hypothetical protein
MIHCITCKTIIPDGERHHTTSQGHILCMSCVSPCGLDTQGIVYHHQCPDGCMVVTTWEEHERFDNTLPF